MTTPLFDPGACWAGRCGREATERRVVLRHPVTGVEETVQLCGSHSIAWDRNVAAELHSITVRAQSPRPPAVNS